MWLKVPALLSLVYFAYTLIAPPQSPQNLKVEKTTAIIDTEIASLVCQVSQANLRRYVAALADFDPRHSLSDTASHEKGIGAARRWVAARFRQFSSCNNALIDVSADPFRVLPTPRTPWVPYPVTMKNVLGTLRGT